METLTKCKTVELPESSPEKPSDCLGDKEPDCPEGKVPECTRKVKRQQNKVKVFCTCDGAVVVVHQRKSDEASDVGILEIEGRGSEELEDAVSPYEVQWSGDDDPLHPHNMSRARKWVVVLILASVSLCSTYTSSVYSATYAGVTADFNASSEIVTLGLSLYVLGLGCGPMFLAPLSEFYGRRPIYLVSWALFVIWLIPCAVAQNIQTLLISRFINGVCGSAFLSVAGGTVGDLFVGNELGLPMMVYTASPFVGPELGPLVGGFINQHVNWRWTYYSLLIWAVLLYLAVVLFVPETFHPVVLKKKAVKLRRDTGDKAHFAPIERHERSVARTIAISCLRPIQLLTLEPMCIALCVFSAVLLGILYLFFEAFPLVFGHNHGFNLQETGLTFLGLLVGMVAGITSNPYWDATYRRIQANYKDSHPPPEYRLRPAMVGSLLVPLGIFWFGWTTFSAVPWIVPIIGSSVFGAGTLLIYSGVWTFLVEAYPQYAASALAANSFLRSAFAAGFPLFAVQMFEKLGYQWAMSLLGFIALACAPFPFLFYKYGHILRARSRFAAKE